ncbi:MAG: pyridoxamine 5'-phosphate oxidase family protein [Planctomycetota bacterium]|nr:pyridoxamine 5'-phosphate oxidase family protein [Planctomycetota bacterium]
MALSSFRRTLDSAADLAALIGTPSELAIKKERTELDQHMRTFLAESPFVLVGTVGRDGRLDVSPRGDAPGIASVIDSKTLVIPERAGNRRADSLRNIIETGRVGLLFMRPGTAETLRVNGRACVMRDEEFLVPLTVQGKTPQVAIGVEIEECFLQCGKALIRSKLWEGLTAVCSSALPDFAQILADPTQIDGQTAETLRKHIEESYANRLY